MSKPMLGTGADTLEQPMAEVPIEVLAQLFTGAAKPDTQWYLGAEIELFPFHEGTHTSANHQVIGGLLERLADRLQMQREYEVNGALIGLKGDEGAAVSLEPGGQVEFASRPHRSLKGLRQELCDWTQTLSDIGRESGIGFWALGHQPFVDRNTSPVMPKPRYDIMRNHLTGGRAPDMMHLTGSVQVTVDFLDTQNLVNKVRTAAKASPFISALVAASPFSLGKLNGYKSMRYQIWLDTDAARCGIWPEMVDSEGLTPERYIQKTLDTAAMFFRRGDRYLEADRNRSFSSYIKTGFNETPVTVSDYLDHLTTFFPEIRPKGYVEMRGLDCILPKLAVAVAGFWRGILDDEPTRQAVDERLSALDYASLIELQSKVAKQGLEADSPLGKVSDIAIWLVDAAYQRLTRSAPDCAECLEPLVQQAQARRSPADELIEIAEKSSIDDALETVRL